MDMLRPVPRGTDRLILDTNVLVRFILGEPAGQAASVARLFQQCDAGTIELVILPLVAAETVFVLTSFYKQERTPVAKVLTHIFSSAGVICGEREILLKALGHFADSKAHFVDCYLAAASEISGIQVASFDRDFDRLPGAARLDPARFK